jgi:hypothetical protein
VSFIKSYLHETRHFESPTAFFKWGAYSIIGAVLRDNVWVRQGDKHTYPSIYVLLLADSARDRKNRPADLVREFVFDSKATKVIFGRTSIQQVLIDLSEVSTDKRTGRITSSGSAIMVAPEMRAFLVDDPASIGILTDIYDFKKVHPVRLRSGVVEIERLCMSLFGASNEELLKAVFTSSAVFGGLLGRTFLVKPDEVRPGNILFGKSDTNIDINFKYLHAKLDEIKQLRGECEPEDDAIAEYKNWYLPFRDSVMAKSDKSGVLSRIHTGILKLAMILAAGHRCEAHIRKVDIEESIDSTMALLPNYSTYIVASGKSTLAEAGTILLEYLRTHGGECRQKDFLYQKWSEVDAEVLAKLIGTLESAGIIRSTYSSDSNLMISLTEKSKEIFNIGDIKK